MENVAHSIPEAEEWGQSYGAVGTFGPMALQASIDRIDEEIESLELEGLVERVEALEVDMAFVMDDLVQLRPGRISNGEGGFFTNGEGGFFVTPFDPADYVFNE